MIKEHDLNFSTNSIEDQNPDMKIDDGSWGKESLIDVELILDNKVFKRFEKADKTMTIPQLRKELNITSEYTF